MRPKKTLGQNFLTSGKAIFEIVEAGDIQKDDFILEIGPGKGALTEKLLEKDGKVIAIEKDSELIPFLKKKFEKEIKEKKLILKEEDILNIDLADFLKKERIIKYKLIANIPYYITGAIIEKFLSEAKKPEKMVLLVQKEVAERIVAKDKKESILSLAVKLYGEPKLIYRVSAGSFFPKPKVDSAILQINLSKESIDKELEEKYLRLIKRAFSHKRKIMLSNLREEWKEANFEVILENTGINKKARAEDLTKEDFLKIANFI
ncbi:MAG: dimethyladenosine transferase, rRNA (adenine1518-N6/adenine1519-N6)-dimethyltransferase [Candidatus Parcubacteria bacterium]|jgi:16S rRNA (adenine1518-N6/adenine1519-N6)-dimethyltransferase